MSPVAATALNKSVAVIGAGAAGLVAARELTREGHSVIVYEQSAELGGVWAYDEHVDSDLLGRDPNRARVHSSMYRDLRTNLPREIMSYTDFPFDPRIRGAPATTAGGVHPIDTRRFPGQAEVLRYLEAFADHYALRQLVQLRTRVVSAEPLYALATADGASNGAVTSKDCAAANTSSVGPRWRLRTQAVADLADAPAAAAAAPTREAEFDAVLVCNGHFTEPNLPELAGQDVFPGLQMHSHNYRQPETFRGRSVLVVGASNSGDDISRELCGHARDVLVCARHWKPEDLEAGAQDTSPIALATPSGSSSTTSSGSGGSSRGGFRRKLMATELRSDGSVVFADGSVEGPVDCVIYCTAGADGERAAIGANWARLGHGLAAGYQYRFPFLPPEIVRTEGGHVRPLYQHMFQPQLGASLAFIGLPFKVVPFPLCELQCRLVARLLAKKAKLPPAQQMQEQVERSFKELEARQAPLRHYHNMDSSQWAYCEWLVDACESGEPHLPDWRRRMYDANRQNKKKYPANYRDVWFEEAAAADAKRDIDRQLGQLEVPIAGQQQPAKQAL